MTATATPKVIGFVFFLACNEYAIFFSIWWYAFSFVSFKCPHVRSEWGGAESVSTTSLKVVRTVLDVRS